MRPGLINLRYEFKIRPLRFLDHTDKSIARKINRMLQQRQLESQKLINFLNFYIIYFYFSIFCMGCEESIGIKQETPTQESETHHTSTQFHLDYHQFIMNTRGRAFDIYHFSSFVHRSDFSIIREVIHRTNHEKRICKIKQISKLKHLSAFNEIEILKKLQHPNIVRIHQYFIEDENLYIIFEKIKGTTIHKWLRKKQKISIEIVLEIMRQLLAAVNAIHCKDIAHRAINPNHIIVQSLTQNKQAILVKLIDFNWAQNIDIKMPTKNKVRECQDEWYKGKESINDPIQHDIYCCGLVFLTLLGGIKCLKNIRKNQDEVIHKFVAQNSQFKGLESLLKQMMHKNPSQRISTSEITKNPLMGTSLNKQNARILFDHFRNFKINDHLRVSLWMFASITTAPSKSRLQYLNEFYSLDLDSDGRIQFDEMVVGLQNAFSMDQSEAIQEAKLIFKNLDRNGNGSIDYYEFVMGHYGINRKLTEKQVENLFIEIDTNNDGYICRQQLENIVEGIQNMEQNGLELNQLRQLIQKIS